MRTQDLHRVLSGYAQPISPEGIYQRAIVGVGGRNGCDFCWYILEDLPGKMTWMQGLGFRTTMGPKAEDSTVREGRRERVTSPEQSKPRRLQVSPRQCRQTSYQTKVTVDEVWNLEISTKRDLGMTPKIDVRVWTSNASDCMVMLFRPLALKSYYGNRVSFQTLCLPNFPSIYTTFDPFSYTKVECSRAKSGLNFRRNGRRSIRCTWSKTVNQQAYTKVDDTMRTRDSSIRPYCWILRALGLVWRDWINYGPH